MAMTLREKVLYHQIHPAKLATDILAGLASLYFFWNHQLWLGLAVHLVPPIVASALLTRFADLEPLRASPLGQYVGRYMTRTVEGVRLLGDLIMVVGAWMHLWWLIPLGVAVVAAAWLSGRLSQPT
jgi:hypothetical protein